MRRGGAARSVLMALLLLFAVVFQGGAVLAAATDSGPDSEAPCAQTIDITTIVSTAEGLEIKSVAPITPRIESSKLYGGVAGKAFSLLVVDIPNGRLAGPASQFEWENGAFASARIVRYRTAVECGLRLRLQPREVANWVVQPRPDGVLVTSPGKTAALLAAASASEPAPSGESGAATVSATGAWSDYDDGSDFSSVVQVGIAQTLRRLGTLKAFAAAINPKQQTGSPYGAIGLFGVHIKRTIVDAAAGDLFVPYGDAGLSQGTYVTNVLIRGGGASVLLPRNFGIQAFSGRAALPSLFRVRTGTVTSEISDDLVHGIQGSWTNDDRTLGLGLGYAISEPVDEPRQENWIQTLVYRSREAYSALVSLEESRNHDFSGYGMTAQPEINMLHTHATGYYRYISQDFRPPLGSSFYSSLRHSYGLSASHDFNSRTNANVSLSQTKNFNPFDPEDVGTLSNSRAVGVSYRILPTVFTTATVTENDYRSEPGAVLPSDSRSREMALGIGFNTQLFSGSLRAGHEETENLLAPADGARSNFLDGDLDRSFAGAYDVYLRWRWADTQKDNGENAGSDYSVDAGVRMLNSRMIAVRGEVGISSRPPGVAAVRYTETRATIGVRTGPVFRDRRVGVSFTYQRLEIPNAPTRQVYLALLDAGALANWGQKGREVAPPFETRAINVGQSQRPEPGNRGDLKVIVFSDANRNGVRDTDEAPLPGINVIIDQRPYVTAADGTAIASVLPGNVKVQLITTGPATEFFVPERRKTVEAKERGLVEVPFALVPAGHVAGALRYEASGDRPASLSGITIVAESPADRFEAITDRRGEFRFGQLPAGNYTISIDRSTLPSALAVKSEEPLSIGVEIGARREIEITVRRATTRERLGIPGGGGGRSRNRRTGG